MLSPKFTKRPFGNDAHGSTVLNAGIVSACPRGQSAVPVRAKRQSPFSMRFVDEIGEQKSHPLADLWVEVKGSMWVLVPSAILFSAASCRTRQAVLDLKEGVMTEVPLAARPRSEGASLR